MVSTPEPTINAEDREDYVPDEELVAATQEVVDDTIVEEDSDFEISMDNVKIVEYRAKEEDGVGNVIQFVKWHYEWTNPDYPGTKNISGFMTELPDPDSENFIDFEEVDVDVLKEWVMEKEREALLNVRAYIMEQFPYEHKLQQSTVYVIA